MLLGVQMYTYIFSPESPEILDLTIAFGIWQNLKRADQDLIIQLIHSPLKS